MFKSSNNVMNAKNACRKHAALDQGQVTCSGARAEPSGGLVELAIVGLQPNHHGDHHVGQCNHGVANHQCQIRTYDVHARGQVE
jgi:hypothetical protein